MFVIYYINMQSLTQTNVFLTSVLHTRLPDTNVLVRLNLQSCRCDASPANDHNEATFAIMCTVFLDITFKYALLQCNVVAYNVFNWTIGFTMGHINEYTRWEALYTLYRVEPAELPCMNMVR